MTKRSKFTIIFLILVNFERDLKKKCQIQIICLSSVTNKSLILFFFFFPPLVCCQFCSHYNNAFYARVGGVSNAELNRLELELLFLLDFGVTVSPRVFEIYCLHLEREMLMVSHGSSQRVERPVTLNGVHDVTEISLEDNTQSSSPPNPKC